MGELKRITAEVSPDLEASHITYLVGLEKSPRSCSRTSRVIPATRRSTTPSAATCRVLHDDRRGPVDHPLKAVKLLQEKFGRKMAPVEVPASQAVSSQNIVEGDKIDIRMFPAQRMWPLDGGLYLGTADAVITMDPDTKRVNVGTYRMMIKGPREIGVYTSPGKDAAPTATSGGRWASPADRGSLWDRPAAVPGWGHDLPKTESEYEYYSGIKGSPIELFTSDLTGLPLPAMPRSSSRAISIPTRPSPKARSESSRAITGRPAAPRPTCVSSV